VRHHVVRRLLSAGVTVLILSVVVFGSIELIPSDAVDIMLGLRRTEESAAALRHKLGLDLPPAVRYVRWLGGVLRGSLGTSLVTEEPVADSIRQRLPVTAQLALLATLIGVAIGVPSGLLSATRRYSVIDHISTIGSTIGVSVPDFWLATLLILVLSVKWRVLPLGGLLPSGLEDPVGYLKRMIMPAVSLGLPSAAVYFRMTRSAMLEVIHTEYITTAYGKGLSERRVIVGHALKNALIPVVTAAGLELTWMVGGSFIIESIFALPGLGRVTLQAIFQRDYTMIQGCLLVYSVVVVALSIGMDLVYAWLDPRIRYE